MVIAVNFKEELEYKRQQTEKIIDKYLPAEEGFAKELAQAMQYSMKSGGKRLRPVLMKEIYDMFGGTSAVIEPFMAAMEMIHTSSLVHDDLPAIDNDKYRRGKLTTHVAFGEAMGILSGDALLNYAYETACKAFVMEPENKRIGQALLILTQKTGIYGMLGGQSVDVTNDGKELSVELLDYIYKNKTSALIECAMMTGAVLAGASADDVKTIEKVAEKVGLAFQIRDDILDVTSTMEELGKPTGSDAKNHKTTYVYLKGMTEACKVVEDLSNKAIAELDRFSEKSRFVQNLIREMINRRN